MRHSDVINPSPVSEYVVFIKDSLQSQSCKLEATQAGRGGHFGAQPSLNRIKKITFHDWSHVPAHVKSIVGCRTLVPGDDDVIREVDVKELPVNRTMIGVETDTLHIPDDTLTEEEPWPSHVTQLLGQPCLFIYCRFNRQPQLTQGGTIKTAAKSADLNSANVSHIL
jgi:hypothetical protein